MAEEMPGNVPGFHLLRIFPPNIYSIANHFAPVNRICLPLAEICILYKECLPFLGNIPS
jgi:hypothetical protein